MLFDDVAVKVTCHHVLIVVDTSEWNFLLVFRCWDDETFLLMIRLKNKVKEKN
jgi:hypothetical protein